MQISDLVCVNSEHYILLSYNGFKINTREINCKNFMIY